MEILNRKAKFNYFVIDEYECGVELKGTEIKSIRKGSANFEDSYGRIKNNEVRHILQYVASLFLIPVLYGKASARFE